MDRTTIERVLHDTQKLIDELEKDPSQTLTETENYLLRAVIDLKSVAEALIAD